MAKRTFKTPTPTAVEQLKALRTGRMPLTPSERTSRTAGELIKSLPATRVVRQDIAGLKRRSKRMR